MYFGPYQASTIKFFKENGWQHLAINIKTP